MIQIYKKTSQQYTKVACQCKLNAGKEEEVNFEIQIESVAGKYQKRRVSYLYRTATTAYPCYLPVLGEFSRSWSYKTYP